ncbi:MAG: extracellular solute-binding protein [Eubacteriales bacterium]|nr:extracellular solute-binding protein [Eubacteriales bacterium]
MKKKIKRLLAVGLAAALVISLAACGSSTSGSSGSSSDQASGTEAAADSNVKTIKFFHRFPDDPANSFIEEKIAEYEAAHSDIDIVITSAQNQPFKEKIKTVVGTAEEPDIYYSWAGEFSERFIRENLILDLTPYLEADSAWKDSLIESQMVNYTTADGMVYGIPFRLDGKVFAYNRDIFDALKLEVPATWDEFKAVLEKIKADGTYTPLAEGNQDQWPGAHYIGTLNQMLVADDVRAADFDPATGTFTDPGYVKALDLYQELVPYMNIGVNGMTHDMARQLFTTGQAAMCYIELVEITNLYQETEGTDFNWGMFVFPTVEGAGNPDILTGEPEGFVVSANTKYPDECVEFLKWFLGPEVGAQQAEVVGWFNASKGIADNLDDEGLVEAYNLIMNAEKMGPWFDASLYSTVCEEYLQQISDITNGDVSSEDAMAKIQATAKEAQTLVK